jgi:hypothetical protein
MLLWGVLTNSVLSHFCCMCVGTFLVVYVPEGGSVRKVLMRWAVRVVVMRWSSLSARVEQRKVGDERG